jgi:hypothetical protein
LHCSIDAFHSNFLFDCEIDRPPFNSIVKSIVPHSLASWQRRHHRHRKIEPTNASKEAMTDPPLRCPHNRRLPAPAIRRRHITPFRRSLRREAITAMDRRPMRVTDLRPIIGPPDHRHREDIRRREDRPPIGDRPGRRNRPIARRRTPIAATRTIRTTPMPRRLRPIRRRGMDRRRRTGPADRSTRRKGPGRGNRRPGAGIRGVAISMGPTAEDIRQSAGWTFRMVCREDRSRSMMMARRRKGKAIKKKDEVATSVDEYVCWDDTVLRL